VGKDKTTGELDVIGIRWNNGFHCF